MVCVEMGQKISCHGLVRYLKSGEVELAARAKVEHEDIAISQFNKKGCIGLTAAQKGSAGPKGGNSHFVGRKGFGPRVKLLSHFFTL